MVGGELAHNQARADVWEYDPSANAWATLTPLPGKRRAAVAGLIDGVIVVTGGWDDTSHQVTTWAGTVS